MSNCLYGSEPQIRILSLLTYFLSCLCCNKLIIKNYDANFIEGLIRFLLN